MNQHFRDFAHAHPEVGRTVVENNSRQAAGIRPVSSDDLAGRLARAESALGVYRSLIVDELRESVRHDEPILIFVPAGALSRLPEEEIERLERDSGATIPRGGATDAQV